MGRSTTRFLALRFIFAISTVLSNMSHELLANKRADVIKLLSTSEVQQMITNPSNLAIAYTFPISCLLKSKRSQVSDSDPAFYIYSLDEAGFKDWHA